MNQSEAEDNWLISVAYSHSQSIATDVQYKRVWAAYKSFIGVSAEQILADYEASDDRTFKRKHANYIIKWIGDLIRRDLARTSIRTMVGAVKSFYKYHSLPLAFVPQATGDIVYHNRDITKDEIVQIMVVSKIREKAFYVVMAQSGLRPHTIRQLKIKNLESLDELPCKIEVPKEITKGKFGSYVTFIGPDATKYLKQYLATRTNLAPDALLFCGHGDSTKYVNVKDVSRAFRLAARKLEKTGALHFEVREGKPSELRFYTLRKFFKKYANQMGSEHVSYMMGHTTRGSDVNYAPKDPAFYRNLYKEKAMPFLRLETATPTETEKTIEKLKEQISNKDQKLQELERKMTKFEPLFELLSDNTGNLERLLKDLEQGRYAKVESETSLAWQVPKRVFEKRAR